MESNKLKKTTLAACVLAVLLGGCEKSLTFEQYMKQAGELMSAEDKTSAVLSLKNAVRMSPKDANARYELGKVYLLLGNVVDAEKELERALELGAANDMLLPQLANAKMMLGKHKETYEIAEQASLLSNETYVMVLTYAGLAAIGAGDFTTAQDYIAQAVALSEESLYSQVGAAWLEYTQDNFTIVEETVSNILQESDFSEALLLAGHLYQAQQNFELAIKHYKAYLEKHPLQFQIKLYLVNSLISANKFDEAEEQLVPLSKLYPSHPLVNLYNAQVAYSKGLHRESKQFAEEAIANNDSLLVGKLIAGISAFHLGESQQAYNHLVAVERYLPSNHEIKKVVAILQLQLGMDDDAGLTLEQLNPESVADMGMIHSASVALSKKGRNDLAEHLMGKLHSANPENKEVALHYNTLKLANGNLDSLDVLSELSNLSETSNDAQMVMATHYINQQMYDEALNIAKEWQKKEPESIRAKLLEGFIFVIQERFPAAISIFEKVLLIDEMNVPANFYLGDFAMKSKDFVKAKEHYLAILKGSPLHNAARGRLARINAHEGKSNETVSFLEELINQHPGNQDLVVDLALNKSFQKNYQEAISLLESKFEAVERDERYQRALGKLYFKTGNFSAAESSYIELTKSYPGNVGNWIELAVTIESQSRLEDALTVLNNAGNSHHKHPAIELLRSNILIKLGRYNAADKIISSLEEEYPNNTDVMYIKALSAYEDEKYATASSYFSRVYKAQRTSFTLIKWAQSESKQGRNQSAADILKENLSNQSTPAVRALLAEILLSIDLEEAIEHYNVLLTEFPNSIAVLNNLSWAYLELQNGEQALALSKRAYSLTKNNPAVIETHAKALIMSGMHDEAVASILDRPEVMNDGLRLTLAEAYVGLSEKNKAQKLVQGLNPTSEENRKRLSELLKQI